MDDRLFYLCDKENNYCGGYLGLILLRLGTFLI